MIMKARPVRFVKKAKWPGQKENNQNASYTQVKLKKQNYLIRSLFENRNLMQGVLKTQFPLEQMTLMKMELELGWRWYETARNFEPKRLIMTQIKKSGSGGEDQECIQEAVEERVLLKRQEN